jgi:hypothetical protein
MNLRAFNTDNCGTGHVWTPMLTTLLQENFDRLSNKEMEEALGIDIHSIRLQLYAMGLYRIRLHYWTDEQVEFLKENYKLMGDTEIAEIFESKWPKDKRWTIKHIEKKRGYLNLKRTTEELIAIEQRNLDQGRLNVHTYKRESRKSNFLTSGPAEQFEIRMYRSSLGVLTSRIRIGKCWLYWPRWAYKKYIGPVPKDHVVVMKDGNPYHTVPENIEAITRAESTRRYAAKTSIQLSDGYIVAQLTYGKPELRETIRNNPALIETKRSILLLKRQIKKVKNGKRQKAA